MRLRTGIHARLLCTALVFASPLAHAAVVTLGSGSSGIDEATRLPVEDSQSIFDTSSIGLAPLQTQSSSISINGGAASSSLSLDLERGLLRANAEASGFNAKATVGVTVRDFWTISGDGQLTLVVDLSGVLDNTGQGSNSSVDSFLQISRRGVGEFLLTSVFSDRILEFQNNGADATVNDSHVAIVDVADGDVISFNYLFSIDASALAPGDGTSPSALADFGNTAIIVRTLSEGVSISQDDPRFLSTVIPVPAAVWLFGSGLLALAGIRRRI